MTAFVVQQNIWRGCSRFDLVISESVICIKIFAHKNLTSTCSKWLVQYTVCAYNCSILWCLCVADCLNWTRRSSVFSTTVQTVAPLRTACPALSFWNMSPRWGGFTTMTATITHTHTSHFFVLSCIVFLIFTPPGNAGDRRGGQPPGRPSLFGGLSVQPWQEAPGGRSQHAVIRSRILRLLLKLSKLSFAGGWSVTRLDFSFFISAGGGWVPPLHATVQPGTGLYWAAASGLAQHVQHRGGRHEPRVEPEWRGQGRLRRSAGAAEQLLWNRSAWLPRNEVV